MGESPSDVAARSDVTITCVTATDDERAALMGAEGEPSPVIDGVRAGSMVLGMSPVSPAATREFEVQLAECGVRLLDSPISGGEYGRLGRTLSIMVGGETEALERVRPILEATGAQITHCGPYRCQPDGDAQQPDRGLHQQSGNGRGAAVLRGGGVDPSTMLAAISAGVAGS